MPNNKLTAIQRMLPGVIALIILAFYWGPEYFYPWLFEILLFYAGYFFDKNTHIDDNKQGIQQRPFETDGLRYCSHFHLHNTSTSNTRGDNNKLSQSNSYILSNLYLF
jgi:hypothetical protein